MRQTKYHSKHSRKASYTILPQTKILHMKQGEEKTQFIKDEDNETRKYIFQKNKKTVTGFYIVLIALLMLVAATIISGIAF